MTHKVRKNDSIQQTEGIASKIVDLSRFGQFSPVLNFQMQYGDESNPAKYFE